MDTPETLQALEQYAFVLLPALLVAEQFGIPLPALPALLEFGAPWRRTGGATFH